MYFKLNKIIRKPSKKVNLRTKGVDLGSRIRILESILFYFTLFIPGIGFPRSNGFAQETAFS